MMKNRVFLAIVFYAILIKPVSSQYGYWLNSENLLLNELQDGSVSTSFIDNSRSSEIGVGNSLKNAEKLTIGSTPDYERITATIDPDMKLKNAKFYIHNIFGRQVLQGRIVEHAFVIEISGLPKGFYILTVSNESVQHSKKFIKK
jgi:hypothetical protein